MTRRPLVLSRRLLAAAATLAVAASLSSCGGDDGATASNGTDDASGGATASTLRLGYFANVTHAAALIGVDQGFFEDELGDTALETQVFNAGPAAVEALFAGALDATYIGPNPAINAYAESDGAAIRIIAGATSGGAALVVRDGIDSVEDLEGATLASPQLGNTQDVALRAYLSDNGLENSVDGGGDVTITPTPNADTLSLFQSGDFDGAWLPEPWASRLVIEAGAHVLVDEKELWPDGKFVTTHLIVRTEFLEQYPGTVDALLRGHVAAVDFANENADEAKDIVNAGIERDTGEALATEVLDRAWDNLTVTDDPIASSLQTSADNAVAAGTSEEAVDLDGIYDLRQLNAILEGLGEDPVSAGGLGDE